jgi:hypothetical protein
MAGALPLHRGAYSIPHIVFIEVDVVFFQELTVFLLKGDATMVLGLIADILLQSQAMRGADRKDPVTALPMKIANENPRIGPPWSLTILTNPF